LIPFSEILPIQMSRIFVRAISTPSAILVRIIVAPAFLWSGFGSEWNVID